MSLVLIETKTLASSTTELVFSNIPQQYYTLYAVGSIKSTRASTQGDFSFKFNGTTAGYSARRMTAFGAAPITDSALHTNIAGTGGVYEPELFSTMDCYFGNYSSTTQVKTVNYKTAFRDMVSYSAGRWNNSSAVTSITFYDLTNNNLAAGTSISLYGAL